MEVTEAAQEVQRSGFPEAYADHEADARVLASALTGNSPAAFSCELGDEPDAERDRLTDVRAHPPRRRRTPRGRRPVRRPAVGGFEPGRRHAPATWRARRTTTAGPSTSSSGRSAPRTRSAAGRSRTTSSRRPTGSSIETVIFDDRIWTGGRSEDGWRDYDPPDAPGDRAILEHRDHVHVDVFD